MAEFQFKCSHCGETVVADENSIGQSDKCPFCNKVIIVSKKKGRNLLEASSSQRQCAISNKEARMKNKSHGPLYYVIITLIIAFVIITLGGIVGRGIEIPSYKSYIAQRNYENIKKWYYNQLEYNGLHESDFCSYPSATDKNEFEYALSLVGGGSGQWLGITLSGKHGEYITYPRSMTVGFARDLINARIAIYKYESAQEMTNNH